MARRSTKPTGTNIDGRLARTARTRDQIVDTLLQLVQEGAHGATLAEIAARAGVTQRTLFNHFPNIGDAVGAALMRSREVSLSLLPAVPTGATPESRVRAFFAAAVQFYEHYSAMRWAALTSPYAVAGFDLRQGKGFVLARLEERVLEACDVIDATLRNDAARRAAQI